MRHLFAAAVLALASCSAAYAQQDATMCTTVTVSRATEADIPQLLADAECFAKAVASAADSQALRLKKVRELAETPAPAPGVTPVSVPSTGDHEGHVPSTGSGHGMPEPPAPKPLTVADITPTPTIRDLSPHVRQVPVPGSAVPDVVGAFRLICNVSHLSYDDPIVYPGQPGKAHLHMFFGNTGADANSTYESLRASGGSTCQSDVLNRSAYWIPALLDGRSRVVVPDYVALYYKRKPASDPDCSRAPHVRCAGIPVGLKALFGTNYVQGQLQSPHVRFDCNSGPSWDNLAETAAGCVGKSHIYARINAPDCWNGRDLDSADHQSHLAYQSRDVNSGRYHCPATHPVVMPKLSLIVAYAVLPGDMPETWIFSSDVMAGAKAGTTFHADYMEAWEPEARLTWEANCLDKLLNCSAADFGNGTQGRAPQGFTFEQRPHWLAIPAH